MFVAFFAFHFKLPCSKARLDRYFKLSAYNSAARGLKGTMGHNGLSPRLYHIMLYIMCNAI